MKQKHQKKKKKSGPNEIAYRAQKGQTSIEFHIFWLVQKKNQYTRTLYIFFKFCLEILWIHRINPKQPEFHFPI